jgi:hypothetical protein
METKIIKKDSLSRISMMNRNFFRSSTVWVGLETKGLKFFLKICAGMISSVKEKRGRGLHNLIC